MLPIAKHLKNIRDSIKPIPFKPLLWVFPYSHWRVFRPLQDFFGKLFLLTSAVSGQMYILLGIAAVNLVLSLYNYLRVIKYMFVDEATEDVPEVKSNVYEIIVYTFCMLGIIAIGFINPIYTYIQHIVAGI